jgi:glycosyltransferase involved in cell wall biosynthesis
MTQVLHVLSTEASFQSRRGAEALRRDPANVFAAEIKTIGRGGTWRSVPFAVQALRRAQCDVVHAWDDQSLLAVVLAGRPRIAFTPLFHPMGRQSSLLRAIFRWREIALICDSEVGRRAWIAAGAPSSRCHLIRPGAATDPVLRQRDPVLRAALGFSETDHVVLAVGESTDAARHDLSVWSVSILHVLDRSERLLLWGRGRACLPALRRAMRVADFDMYSVAETKLRRCVEFEELCSAADMALVTAQGPVATLPLAICMARGIPIVATPSPIVSEMLEDGVSAKMAPPLARQIARGIGELRASPGLQQTLSTNAMAQARDHFAPSRYIAQHRQLYAQMADGKDVDLSCSQRPSPTYSSVRPPVSERFVTS